MSGIFPAEYEQKNNDPGIYDMVKGQQNKYESRMDVEYQGGNVSLTAKNHNNKKLPAGSDTSVFDNSVPYPTRCRLRGYSDEDSVNIPPAQQSGQRTGRSPRVDAVSGLYCFHCFSVALISDIF